jgi:anti-sigma regulatory factor (Ser/Thr protein kinase)
MSDVRSAEIMLDPHPSSVGRARRWISRQLEEWSLDDLDYDVSVVLSELVTNAVLHARTQIELRASKTGDVVRVEVFDQSDTMPAPRSHISSSTTGRGLHLVAALATSWGWEPQLRGKTVWAEFAEVREAQAPHGTVKSVDGKTGLLGSHRNPASQGGTSLRSLRRGAPVGRIA